MQWTPLVYCWVTRLFFLPIQKLFSRHHHQYALDFACLLLSNTSILCAYPKAVFTTSSSRCTGLRLSIVELHINSFSLSKSCFRDIIIKIHWTPLVYCWVTHQFFQPIQKLFLRHHHQDALDSACLLLSNPSILSAYPKAVVATSSFRCSGPPLSIVA